MRQEANVFMSDLCPLEMDPFPKAIITVQEANNTHTYSMRISLTTNKQINHATRKGILWYKYSVSSRKHAYIILTPINPTFI